jgi:integrase
MLTYKVKLRTSKLNIEKKWFVEVNITDESGNKYRKQFRGGINYSHDKNERLRAGKALKKYWEEKIKEGWTPFIESTLSEMRFNDALVWALDKCVVAKKTKLDYSVTVDFFKEAAKELRLDKQPVTLIKKQHIMLMLDKIKEDRKWSNHAWNKNSGYICAVLSRLVRYEVIKSNPAAGISQLSTAESNKYETLTDQEKLKLRKNLEPNLPAYYTYLMLLYHTGIRPKEALALKLPDVRLQNNMIVINPDLQIENSKTKTIRMVTLNRHIKDLLIIHLKDCKDPSYFIFGSPNKPHGARNKAKLFFPSPLPMKRDTATKFWKEKVWKGLEIHKYQYALKHTAGDDMILSGVPIDAIKENFGHSSKYMTEKYVKKLKGLQREELIEKSPEFGKSAG